MLISSTGEFLLSLLLVEYGIILLFWAFPGLRAWKYRNQYEKLRGDSTAPVLLLLAHSAIWLAGSLIFGATWATLLSLITGALALHTLLVHRNARKFYAELGRKHEGPCRFRASVPHNWVDFDTSSRLTYHPCPGGLPGRGMPALLEEDRHWWENLKLGMHDKLDRRVSKIEPLSPWM